MAGVQAVVFTPSYEQSRPTISQRRFPMPQQEQSSSVGKSGSSIWWAYVIGILIGILITLTVTILVAWIIGRSVPHSDWLRRTFYGTLIGCNTA